MILMTVSPTRAHPDVLRAMATPPPAIDDPASLAAFGSAIRSLRQVLGAPSGQIFILPGTGTLGMETLVANWLAPGDRLLVASTGYWGDRFAIVARRHDVIVHRVAVAPGLPPDVGAVEQALLEDNYRALAWTHVDSSTGVLADTAPLAALARRYGALSLVDGVAGAGAEPFSQEADDVDVYLTATPKALAVPAGLILVSAGPRALHVLERRTHPPLVYALDLIEWLPVMRALERGSFAYFNTPALNLVLALDVGLARVLEEGLEARWARHRRLAAALRAGTDALGLAIVALPTCRSSVLTTFRYPEGIGRELVAAMRDEGVVVAGGFHPEIGDRSFRIGHLGWVCESDVLATLAALDRTLVRLGAAPAHAPSVPTRRPRAGSPREPA
jgi:alanine-glyoxylate transaminase/serine-glyoxylate transaminase/serine-pyruvate transaminase